MNNAIQSSGLAIITLVTLSFTACKPTISPIEEGTLTGVNNVIGEETYHLEAASSNYRGHLKRNSERYIINPLVAPTNQTYYFDFDNTKLRPMDLKAILVQANYLAIHVTAKVRLEGNTDNRGSREYNIGLGWRRDQAVSRMLEQEGVAPKQIDLVSYGKERPAVMGNSEYTWGLNRRVNLIYEAY